MQLSEEKKLEIVSRAFAARKTVITTAARSGACHIGSSLSPIDILTTLYFAVLRIDPQNHQDSQRDRCILSKGHGGLGLYAVLAERGFFPQEELESYCKNDTRIAVHPIYRSVPGIEATSGSLGHGLSIGLGLAIAAQRNKEEWRSFVVLSDGECDEGSTWEAVLLAGHLKTDNLIAIVDYNKIQSFGTTAEVLDLEPFGAKWEASGWGVKEVNGHDVEELHAALTELPLHTGKPTVVIAHTIKGKGVPFMENTLDWHYKNIKPEDLEATLNLVY